MPSKTRRPTSGIYKLTIGSWYYFGSTKDYARRKSQHGCALKRGDHPNPILQSAFNKYGAKALKFKLVERARNAEDIYAMEQVWIDRYHGKPRCANIQRDVNAAPHGPKSEATKRKISESLKARGVKPSITAHARKHCKKTKPKGVVIAFASIHEAARRLRVSHRAVQFWLTGKRTVPAGLTIRAA